MLLRRGQASGNFIDLGELPKDLAQPVSGGRVSGIDLDPVGEGDGVIKRALSIGNVGEMN